MTDLAGFSLQTALSLLGESGCPYVELTDICRLPYEGVAMGRPDDCVASVPEGWRAVRLRPLLLGVAIDIAYFNYIKTDV